MFKKLKDKKGLHPRRTDRCSGYSGYSGRPADSGSDWLY